MLKDTKDNHETRNYKNLFNFELYNNTKYYIYKTDPKLLERFL